jgi:hypothetical protein
MSQTEIRVLMVVITDLTVEITDLQMVMINHIVITIDRVVKDLMEKAIGHLVIIIDLTEEVIDHLMVMADPMVVIKVQVDHMILTGLHPVLTDLTVILIGVAPTTMGDHLIKVMEIKTTEAIHMVVVHCMATQMINFLALV